MRPIFIYNAVLVFVFGVNKKVTETNIFHFIVHASTIVTTSCFHSLDGLLNTHLSPFQACFSFLSINYEANQQLFGSA